VLTSFERFLRERLRLTINREKSAVDRTWSRKFLGYTVTPHRQPKLKVSPQSVRRLKDRLREMFRRGRGRSLRRVLEELRPVLRGWVSYYRKSQVRVTFEELDQWIRRKLRTILWRQWKRPWTRAREGIGPAAVGMEDRGKDLLASVFGLFDTPGRPGRRWLRRPRRGAGVTHPCAR
jgi:RNA-directed DNA polymerase